MAAHGAARLIHEWTVCSKYTSDRRYRLVELIGSDDHVVQSHSRGLLGEDVWSSVEDVESALVVAVKLLCAQVERLQSANRPLGRLGNDE